MTDAASGAGPAVTAGPPPTADPQDPLPESSWFWRRVFVFLFGLIAVIGVAVVLWMLFTLGNATLELVAKLSGPRDVRALDQSFEAVGAVILALYKLGSWSMIVLLVGHILYLIAPSAEQAAKMMATVSAWRGGISTSTTSRATGPEGTAETTTTTGKAAPGPAPSPAVGGPAQPAAPARPASPTATPVVDLSQE